ncbi:MAG: triose-phosphate isomerase, partial [Nitrososphaerales archaeon]
MVQRSPILVINFKNYLEVSGPRALDLSRSAEKVSADLNANIALVPPIPSLAAVCEKVSLPVFSQHFDVANVGGSTGAIVMEVCKEAGAAGTLLNHSEKRIGENVIGDLIPKIRNFGMQSVVCANSPGEVSRFAPLAPDFIA